MSQPVELSTTVLCTSIAEEPSRAQLRLDETTLAVEGPEITDTVGLDEVFDVRLGSPPQAASGAFSGPVLTVGFERDDQRAVLFVGGDEPTPERVSGLLFSRLLDGTEVAACHPASIGGRVTDNRFDIGELRVAPGKVGCTGIRRPLHADLGSIVNVTRGETELLGRREPAVTVQYVKHGVVVEVDLSLNPDRKLNLLGRYLRQEYGRTRQRVAGLDPSPAVLRTLVRLYTHRGSAAPRTVLDREATDSETLLGRLLGTDLVDLSDGELRLRPPGWILVAERVGTAGSSSDRVARPSG